MSLIVHRDSRTENLAQQLVAAIEDAPLQNALAPQTIVVAHLGLRRWLLGEFARQRGIAANFDMILPWQWLERTARILLGDAALIDGAYRAEALRWRIYATLPALGAAPVRAYLQADDTECRRFQLADHLAGVYAQYLIYRPDWILDWERGSDRDNWQADLWRRLRASIDAPHRAQRRGALLAALAKQGDGERLPLHVFGVSHLAPDILDALHRLATHRPVHLYFPDPCREYWADLKTRRELLKQPESDDLYFEVGHPLLVSLGRMAQDFFLRLDELEVELGGEETHDAEPSNLLQTLQASIRNCAPALVTAHVAHDRDTSLRVHACHTRLRELEVLKDALLGFLADDKQLQHRDIVVMAPNIAAYAPYLRAVFGEPARYVDDRAHIPWHLADVGLASTHPLLAAFARALDLGESRFALSEVMDFLDVAAVARRFGIDASAREAIERWLRAAHVAWGLDATMKARAGGAPIDQNSWSFGFDRLYAGLVAGEDTDEALLDGILPVGGISGGDGEAIGRLDRLIEGLRRLREGFATKRALLAWRDWLIEQLDALFDARDDTEVAAFEALRRALVGLDAQADAAGHEALPWSVMREAVRSTLDQVSERQPFLLGGVTFCGLVPQRSIPFRVVCLLGMNEGEFPRQGGDAGLNRMLDSPRRGDRDTRREDRYLFLEALMAAREQLHISYVGEGVQDGKRRNPASPLAELLQFLDAQIGIVEPRPWLVRHPLQPFDASYFDRSDARLFSFDPGFAQTAPHVTAVPFINADVRSPETVVRAREVSLASLKRYWRDPARAQLHDAAGLSLEALDSETWPDREPLKAAIERRDGIEQRLLRDALAQGSEDVAVSAPDWLARSGALAAGAAGERAYAQARERAQTMLTAARGVLGTRPQSIVRSIDIDLGDSTRLVGHVDTLHCADCVVRVFRAKPGGSAGLRDLLAFYIDFAAAKHAGGAEGTFLHYEKKLKPPVRAPKLLDAILAQNNSELRTGLRRLVELAATPALLLPPYTAWAWMNREDAHKQWVGGDYGPGGERNYTPGYAALLARDLDFLDPTASAHARFVSACNAVASVLDPQRRILLRGAA
jgi:exodeoxyribonuclease V gamma subunit